VTVCVLTLVRARLAARVYPFFIRCCPSIAAGLYAFLDGKCTTYASIRGTQSGVIPPQRANHLASPTSGMVDVSRPAIGNADVIDDLRVSPWGVRHSQASTRSLNRPRSLNGALSIALGRELPQPHPDINLRCVEGAVKFATNRSGDALRVVLPTQEYGDNVTRGAGADPKLVLFGIVDASLCLDASECYIHLPHAFCGRSVFCKLMELYELYVIERTYVDPPGYTGYRTA
jgi:hypothetical protein